MDKILGGPMAGEERDFDVEKVNEHPEHHLRDVQAKDDVADSLCGGGNVNTRK